MVGSAGWRSAKELESEEKQLKAALLVYEASPRFYDLFSSDKSALFRAVARQFSLPETELSDTLVYERDNEIVGLYSAYATGALRDLQMGSLKALFEIFPPKRDLTERLRAYRELVAPVGETGAYLARIATDSLLRNAGIGSILLAHFEQNGAGAPFCLHVDRDNVSAIRFYLKKGYRRPKGSDSFLVTLMSKNG